jgi:hypothetical protein
MADPNPVEIKLTSTADTGGIEKTVEGLNETTEATKQLSEAEADRARRKAEYEARLADKRATGTNGGSESGGEANPFTDGSQLRAVNEVTEAVQEQSKSWEELSQTQEDATVVAQRLADVEEARRIGRERDIENAKKEAEEAVKERDAAQANFAAKAAGIGLVVTAWSTLTKEVKAQIDALREISPAAAEQFRAYELGLEALSNPFRAAILPVIRETENEMELLRQSIDNAAQAEARYQAAVVARAKEIETAAKNRIEGTLQRELNILDDQNKAYERRLRLLDSERDKLEVIATLNDAARKANGEDPATVDAQAAGRRAGLEQSKLQERAAKAQFDLDQANEALQSLTDAIAGAASPVQREELREKREELIRQRDDLRAEFDTVLQEVADQEAIENARLQDSIRQVSEQKQKEAAELAGKVADQIENSGQELAEINKRGIAKIREVAADGRVTEAEMSTLRDGFAAAQAGLRLDIQTLISVTADMRAATADNTAAIRQLQLDADKAKQQAALILQRGR